MSVSERTFSVVLVCLDYATAVWSYRGHASRALQGVFREPLATERDDSEQVGAVTLSDPETVERIPPTDPIEEVRIADIAPSPYTARRYS